MLLRAFLLLALTSTIISDSQLELNAAHYVTCAVFLSGFSLYFFFVR